MTDPTAGPTRPYRRNEPFKYRVVPCDVDEATRVLNGDPRARLWDVVESKTGKVMEQAIQARSKAIAACRRWNAEDTPVVPEDTTAHLPRFRRRTDP